MKQLTLDDLLRLKRLALPALAARFGRRLHKALAVHYPEITEPSGDKHRHVTHALMAIKKAEEFSSNVEAAHWYLTWKQHSKGISPVQACIILNVVEPGSIFNKICAGIVATCQESLDWAAKEFLKSVELLSSITDEFDSSLREDYDYLLEGASKNNWTDDTAIPSWFFPSCSKFDHQSNGPFEHAIEVANFLDRRLASEISQNPKSLIVMPSRRFEELVAELLDGFGFNIELTARTRDGGVDVIAIDHRVISAKYLVQCKRYARQHAVGVEPIRALHGVVASEGATKGILVTTGRFSAPAAQYLARHRWILEGRDLDGLLHWLDLYQRFLMENVKGTPPRELLGGY